MMNRWAKNLTWLLDNGWRASAIARRLGVSVQSIHNWRRKAEGAEGDNVYAPLPVFQEKIIALAARNRNVADLRAADGPG